MENFTIMENTLLTAAAIAVALGLKNNQKIQKNNLGSMNYSAVKEAIRKAGKALERG